VSASRVVPSGSASIAVNSILSRLRTIDGSANDPIFLRREIATLPPLATRVIWARWWSWRPSVRQLGMIGIIGGAALLIAAPFSLQWSQKNVSLSLASAEARTATRIAGVSRRTHRRAYRCAAYASVVFCDVPRNPFNVGAARYRPTYISPPAGSSYYLPPLSHASSYNYR